MPVNIIDTLKPKNGLNFPVVEAIDVFVEDYENLADAISHFATDVMIEAINTVLSGKANTSDVNTAVSGLQGQIDQIVISASAEAVVAPEVAQARAPYSTLNERLNQIDNNTNALLSPLLTDTYNLIDVNRTSKVKGNVNGGTMSYDPNANCISFVLPCTPNTYYTVSRKNAAARLGIGFSDVMISENESSELTKVVSANNSDTQTAQSTANSAYIIVWVYNSNYDASYNYAIDELMLTTENEVLPYQPPSKVEVNTDVLSSNVMQMLNKGNSALQPSDVDDTLGDSSNPVQNGAVYNAVNSINTDLNSIKSTTYNEFDVDNMTILNGNVNNADATFRPSVTAKTFILPCEANTAYLISRKNATARLYVGFSSTLIDGSEQVSLIGNVYGGNEENEVICTSPLNSAYILVYYYHSSYDSDYDSTLEEMMVAKSSETLPYKPHIAVQIAGDTLAPSVRADIAKGVYAYNHQTGFDRWSSRKGIFGISFDTTDSTATCTRIADSALLNNNYIIDGTYVNTGTNDFDNIFPWCEMRLCNVKFDNGNQIITYEGETGFKRDGTNGNVMIEIPAFYFKRERINDVETWAITGEKKSGFEIEPWFLNDDGSISEFRYYGAYECSADYKSKSGTKPLQAQQHGTSKAGISASGFECNNFAAISAIRHLMAIEFAEINIQRKLKGVGWFYYNGKKVLNVGETTNTVKISASHDGLDRERYFDKIHVGNQVCIGVLPDTTNYRTVTAVSLDSEENRLYFTFDGEPITMLDTYYFYGTAQRSGATDAMNYHTGCYGENSGTYPIKYRGIENPYGNEWEMLDGIRYQEEKYYYTFDPTKYEDADVTNWNELSYAAPEQTGTTATNQMWIVRMGYDTNARQIMMPDVVGGDNGGSDSTYYGDGYYSTDTSELMLFAHGGGWDHSVFGGLFTMRALGLNSQVWLYGERIIL